jgi:phosphoribosylaminoimidazolecarboxamide formyltransferase / IMP cyclohydrolase
MEAVRMALLSVFHKQGLEDFAKGLVDLGFLLVSSGGTAKYLKEKGFEVTDVAEITGYPSIVGHRVVTLHPKIHAGILALDNAEHQADLDKYGIHRFDVVCVDLYPVVQAIAKDGASVESVMEMTDIGGPTLIRGAAKNHQNVIVVCDPADREWVIQELKTHDDLSPAQRCMLAEKVFDTMAGYDDAIRKFLSAQNGRTVDTVALYRGVELAYAENRCQNPAHLFSSGDDDPLAPSRFEWVSGTPSYISMADAAQIMEVLCLMAESFRRSYGKAPYIVVAGKHGNPCGAAISHDNPLEAINKALMGDAVAIMGGEVVTNFSIGPNEADALMTPIDDIGRGKWGLDLVLAPEFSDEAANILGKREKRRLLANMALTEAPFPSHQWIYRQVRNDWIRQMAPSFVLIPNAVQSWSGKQMSREEFESAIIAFACCWRASSNTVALAVDRMLIGLGCGQQDRIACVRLCLDRANRAGHDTHDSIFASDAFFPYAEAKQAATDRDIQGLVESAQSAIGYMSSDNHKNIRYWSTLAALVSAYDRREGPQLLIDAGCAGGVVPADGKELENVQRLFEANELAVAFLPPQFRGFSKH